MIAFDRTNTSILGRWWWTVDRWLLGAVLLMIALGALLMMAASPAVAERLHLNTFYFVERHMILLPLALALMIGISLLSPGAIKRLALGIFLGAVLLMVLVLIVGVEIKGARRWLALPGFSLQPSELMKPAFAVVAALLFAGHREAPHIRGDVLATLLWLIVTILLVAQPDLGMAFVLFCIWGAEIILAGLNGLWVIAIIGGVIVSGIGAYFLFPHFASRIDRFMDPASGDTYQVQRALEGFAHGGLIGKGPGEGVVKEHIPDVHADFIFAAAGEEFGLLFCLFIVFLYGFIVWRGFRRSMGQADLFSLLAASGLIVQFGMQAVINMASTLSLMPTKGMTLPFISYGGSSLLGVAIGMGMLLGLTRKRPDGYR
ncbi:MAG: FtsW/RodA/SpoVE family cell cycle protein [Dongiaceae bacterium]